MGPFRSSVIDAPPNSRARSVWAQPHAVPVRTLSTPGTVPRTVSAVAHSIWLWRGHSADQVSVNLFPGQPNNAACGHERSGLLIGSLREAGIEVVHRGPVGWGVNLRIASRRASVNVAPFPRSADHLGRLLAVANIGLQPSAAGAIMSRRG
jgi:hypothetical protein